MAKYKLKQRFPRFFSGFTPIEVEFDTLEELYNVSFVKRWMGGEKFKRISKSPSLKSMLLMCELEDSYWAIGYLYNADDLALPIFDKSSAPKPK